MTLEPRLHSHPQNTHDQASGQPSHLEQAYLATFYLAETPAGQLAIRIGRHHPDLDRLLAEQGCDRWAYITAYNPGSVLLGEEENQRRQRVLEEEIEQAGWAFYPGEGVGVGNSWPAEKSVLILGIGRKEAIDLAERHGQAALVSGERGRAAELVWTCARVP